MSKLQSLFEGQDLSEEFKEKAEIIFASVIEEQVNEAKVTITTQLQEEFDAKVLTKIEELDEASKLYMEQEVMPSVDKYLTAAAQEWMTENTVAIEAAGKVALAESFLTGLVGLAADHRMTLPEGEDKTVALQKQIDELSEKSKSLLDSNIELQKENIEHKKGLVITSVTSDLSEAQKEKLQAPFALVEFKTEDQYTAALKSLAESYFPVGTKEPVKEPVLNEPLINENLSREELYYRSLREAVTR